MGVQPLTITTSLLFDIRKFTKDLQRSLVESSSELDTRSGIYTEVVTIWLMIFQRLNPDRSLAGAIEKLRSGYFEDILDTRSSRVREGKILSGTGGYSRARNRLDFSRVEEAADAINHSRVYHYARGERSPSEAVSNRWSDT